MEDFEARIAAIESRNARVSADKAWETSLTRRLSIAALTYIIIGIYLSVIHNSQPWINATVPPVGYLLSTLVLANIKGSWIDRRLRRRSRGQEKDY